MKRTVISIGLVALLISTIEAGSGHQHSLYLDTQGRLGYSLSIAKWLDAGLAGSIHFQGLATQRSDASSGGSVKTDANAGLLLPVLDVHPAWSGMELGFKTYFAIHDMGPRPNIYTVGEWIRADLYLAYPLVFDRLSLVPSAYLVKYGYSLEDEFHEFGYGLLLEARVAFRF
jgi:hypothetical protein